jgi:hypothetical protein
VLPAPFDTVAQRHQRGGALKRVATAKSPLPSRRRPAPKTLLGLGRFHSKTEKGNLTNDEHHGKTNLANQAGWYFLFPTLSFLVPGPSISHAHLNEIATFPTVLLLSAWSCLAVDFNNCPTNLPASCAPPRSGRVSTTRFGFLTGRTWLNLKSYLTAIRTCARVNSVNKIFT